MEHRIVKVGGSGVHGTIEFGNFYDKVGLPYEIWKIIEFHISCKIISEEFPEKLCLLRLITFLQRQEGGVIAARLENSLLPDLTVRIHLAKSENLLIEDVFGTIIQEEVTNLLNRTHLLSSGLLDIYLLHYPYGGSEKAIRFLTRKLIYILSEYWGKDDESLIQFVKDKSDYHIR